MTIYYVTGGDRDVMKRWRKAAREGGMALGASEAEAEAVWMEHVINYGLEYNRPWLVRHPDGSVSVTRLTVASMELCAHFSKLQKEEK